MGETDYLSLLEGPPSSAFGTTLYDFGYQPQSLPPSEVATTASQVESGGSGVNWNFGSGVGNLIQDITKAWITVKDHKSATELPTGQKPRRLFFWKNTRTPRARRTPRR